jgi:hypothetical protein
MIMNKFPQTSWEEIYQHWELYSSFGPSILTASIAPVEVYIDYDQKRGVFYGYDWLSSDEYKSRKELIEGDLTHFFYFTKPTNKGTIHTLNMLVNSVSDEERAAIWIYAFAKEISDSLGQGNIYRYSWQLCDVARGFLSHRYFMWHHAMRRLVPEVFISHSVYCDTEFRSIDAVVELARLNAALVLYEYVPVLYTSLGKGEKPPNYSVRRATE